MTLRAAVLGHPISHSKSPALHRAAYAHLGVDIAYSAIDVTEAALPDFMRQVRDEVRADGSWRGLSVTMPLKSAMVAEVDEVRGVGRVLGVVNTVAFESDGGSADRTKMVAYNTDVAGIVNALRYAGAASTPTAAVLGGGGTAAAAIAALKELGAASAEVFVRDVRRATEARAASSAVGLPVQVLPLAGKVLETSLHCWCPAYLNRVGLPGVAPGPSKARIFCCLNHSPGQLFQAAEMKRPGDLSLRA